MICFLRDTLTLPDLGSRCACSGAEAGGTAATPADKEELLPFPKGVMHHSHLAQFKRLI